MSLFRDLQVLYHLAFSSARGGSHAERLENFYRGQAQHYDDFRKRLLKGREEMYQALTVPDQGLWADLGGGTGANLEFIRDRISRLEQLWIVDLAPSLLAVAAERIQRRAWQNVSTLHADATCFEPPQRPLDVITCSYSLTMVPDWFAVIDHAFELLRPGGQIGVVDFYVSRKFPTTGHQRHPWFTRSFWPVWFAQDNVYPSTEHLPYLCRKFEVVQLHEHLTRIPYIPFIKAPYYWFIGKKPE